MADWTPRPTNDLGVEVARVAERPIYAAEVAAQSERSGLPPGQALQQLIEFNLLAERARGAGLAQQPAADPAWKGLLVERLLELEFEALITRDKVPAEDLRKLYQQNQIRFVHPRMVEVALLSVYTGPNMKPEPRARAEATGRALYDLVAKRPLRTPEDFREIATTPEWSARKVQFWRFFQGPDRPYGPFGKNMGSAIQKLRTKGETSALIIDDSGYHIARYIDEKPPINVPFEQAREEILTGYFPIWRKQRFVQWTTGLSNVHKAEVFADRLLAVTARPAN